MSICDMLSVTKLSSGKLSSLTELALIPNIHFYHHQPIPTHPPQPSIVVVQLQIEHSWCILGKHREVDSIFFLTLSFEIINVECLSHNGLQPQRMK